MRTFRIFILFTIALTILLDAYTSAEQNNDPGFKRVILTKRQTNNDQTFQEFIKRNFAYIDKKYQRLKKRQSPTSIIPLTDEVSAKNDVGYYGPITIGRKKSNSNDVSFMTLGGIDQTAVTGSVEYNNANVSIGVWIIPLTDVKVDGNSVGATTTAAIVDTGTTLVYGPTTVVNAIHSRIPNAVIGKQDSQEFWAIPCNTKSVVSLSFNGGSYNIDPAELVLLPSDQGYCVSGIQPNPDGFWLLGDVFLSSVYSVFDFDKNRVGFSQTKIMSSTDNVISNSVKISPPVFWNTFVFTLIMIFIYFY
ncbi:acid protease [Gigaspora margarita]|uniref:Acid protease n=1 Tax=Gigaspora margarita TaxID=4874 RepID=A0A8H4ADC9_GIGMA|nr:acid protease [Gigaspora margarita]